MSKKSFDQIIMDKGTGYSVEKMISAFIEAGYSDEVARKEALLRDERNKEIREKYYNKDKV